MNILENFSLQHLNTFGIDVLARYYVEINSIREIKDFLKLPFYKNIPKLILGGGSNILFTRNFDGVIIKNYIKGTKLIKEDDKYYYLKAGAGEVWHDLICYCLNHNYAGIENLSLIPGSVGAAPIQNIGAYGVELKQSFHELEAVHLETADLKIFSKEECKFGYRDSIFKNKLKNQYIITSVTLRFKKTPIYNISYGAIKEELTTMNVATLNIKSISEAVCNIRKSKLPDPKVIGNAGSFFKNPEITQKQFIDLKNKYPGIIAYPASDTQAKLAAGWLIEQCGWKGKTFGNVGVHKNQALVLVNYGNGTGKDIFKLAREIQVSVLNKFNIKLETEVNII